MIKRVAINDIQTTLLTYRNATDQILSKRWTISTAPPGRPASKVTANILYSDLSDPAGFAIETFGARPLRSASLVSAGMFIVGALPLAAAFSTKSSWERPQIRTLTILGRDPLIRFAARASASGS